MCACSWCEYWMRGSNVLAKCSYSGCNLIVLDCVLSRSGIGPGLG